METWLYVVLAIIALIPTILSVIANMQNQKRMKKQNEQRQSYLKSLKVGDEVLTLSGMYGKIIGIKDTVVELNIFQQVNIFVEKESIMGKTKGLLFK